MYAEVLSIGDEIVSGQCLDTNCQWLSQRLAELGVRVLYHTSAADDLPALAAAFRQAASRARVVVATGGLGPTADDLTRQALAEAAGVELTLDPASLEHIRELFARRARPMPPANEAQAWFPRGARAVFNPRGTAPGVDLEWTPAGGGPCRVFCLPGVPAEMKEMWGATVAPALVAAGLAGGKVIAHRRIKCFGVGESDLEQMLPDLIRRGRAPAVGITVSQATITLRVTAEGPTLEACRQQMAPTLALIRDCLGDLVYGEEDDELQDAVCRLLAARKETVATLEIGGRGWLAAALAQADPAGNVCRGGTRVARPVELRRALPDLPPEFDDRGLADSAGLTEAACAAAAVALRRRFATDHALVLAPPPSEADIDNASATLRLALASATGVENRSTPYAGHPEVIPARAVKQALNLLRLKLAEG